MDQRVFLARVKRRLATPAPPNPAHPMPPMPATVPEVESHLLDPHDLPGSFERAAKAVSAEVHRINGNRVPPELVAELVERYGVKRAVISAEPEAAAVADELRALAVEVEPLSIEAAARADLGVTSASYGLATTGTVVQESAVAGGRTASLLPPVHLCVLPASRLVPSTSAVLRTMGAPGRLPSNLVLITGPSRSGDIEQIITLGVHGPTALHIALLEESG
jgi:L-lactate dehydrogenase complex protein LldG